MIAQVLFQNEFASAPISLPERRPAICRQKDKTHQITIGVFRMEKTTTGSLLAFLAVCYVVAFIAGMITRPEISTWYATLAKPAWRSPNWLFAPVWTVLYGLMAVAARKVWCSAPPRLRTIALWIFGAQLAINFLWSPVFF
jgi:tryptophan-rich sensory protein